MCGLKLHARDQNEAQNRMYVFLTMIICLIMVDEILLVPNNFRPRTSLRITDGFFVLTPTGVKYKEPSVCKFWMKKRKNIWWNLLAFAAESFFLWSWHVRSSSLHTRHRAGKAHPLWQWRHRVASCCRSSNWLFFNGQQKSSSKPKAVQLQHTCSLQYTVRK